MNQGDTWGAGCPALPPAADFSTHTVTNVARVLENTNLYGINRALQDAVARGGAGWGREGHGSRARDRLAGGMVRRLAGVI